MECDELIEQMLIEPDQHVDQHTEKHRERLMALVDGGKCSQYLRDNYTTEKIDNMTDEEIKIPDRVRNQIIYARKRDYINERNRGIYH